MSDPAPSTEPQTYTVPLSDTNYRRAKRIERMYRFTLWFEGTYTVLIALIGILNLAHFALRGDWWGLVGAAALGFLLWLNRHEIPRAKRERDADYRRLLADIAAEDAAQQPKGAL